MLFIAALLSVIAFFSWAINAAGSAVSAIGSPVGAGDVLGHRRQHQVIEVGRGLVIDVREDARDLGRELCIERLRVLCSGVVILERVGEFDQRCLQPGWGVHVGKSRSSWQGHLFEGDCLVLQLTRIRHARHRGADVLAEVAYILWVELYWIGHRNSPVTWYQVDLMARRAMAGMSMTGCGHIPDFGSDAPYGGASEPKSGLGVTAVAAARRAG